MRFTLGSSRGGWTAERGRVLAEEDGDPVEPGADPHDFAGCAELVELPRVESGNPAWQYVRLPERDRQRQSLQRHERLTQRGAAIDAMPVRQEAAERRLLCRFDFLPERGERRAPQTTQNVGVAPLSFAPARPQLTTNELLLTLELLQQRFHVATEALVRLRGSERPAAARVARHELVERVGGTLEEHLRQPAGRHDAERIAVSACVLRGNQPLLVREAHEESAPLAQQRLGEAFVVLSFTEVTAQAQLIVQLVRVTRIAAQLRLDILDRACV